MTGKLTKNSLYLLLSNNSFQKIIHNHVIANEKVGEKSGVGKSIKSSIFVYSVIIK